ncbi:MAG: hypothetical protein ACM3ML_09065 [Micromonosporaceae bacterium]
MGRILVIAITVLLALVAIGAAVGWILAFLRFFVWAALIGIAVVALMTWAARRSRKSG